MNYKLICALLLLQFIISSTTTHAHITINPKEFLIGRHTVTIKVPNEKDIPTTELKIIIPQEVEVTGIMPIAGWTHAEKYENNESGNQNTSEDPTHEKNVGRITEITWKGQIAPGEFMELPISVNYTKSVSNISWKAYQTYSNGNIVAWDDSNIQYPSAKVTVLEKTQAENNIDSAFNEDSNNRIKDNKPLFISIVSFFISVIALMLTFKRISK